MSCYQLSCGHWQDGPPGLGTGNVLGCLKCNTFRGLVIGMSDGTASWTMVLNAPVHRLRSST